MWSSTPQHTSMSRSSNGSQPKDVKTNVYGTHNLLGAAREHGVERFINISTDKAADPSNVLGTTKRIAERLTAAADAGTAGSYMSVRFGNVLGSNGSVIPTFAEQIRRGEPVTVTHPEATRYFMTVKEAVLLVLQSGALGQGGDVMVLDMGEPVRIIDLPSRIAAEITPGKHRRRSSSPGCDQARSSMSS